MANKMILKWVNGGGQSPDNQWDYRFWVEMTDGYKLSIKSEKALNMIKELTVNGFKNNDKNTYTLVAEEIQSRLTPLGLSFSLMPTHIELFSETEAVNIYPATGWPMVDLCELVPIEVAICIIHLVNGYVG